MMHDLEPVTVASWHGWWSGVAVRATRGWRRYVRAARAGYNYYLAAVRLMVPVANTAGKRGYQDSDYYC
jgi:hypothetical protein